MLAPEIREWEPTASAWTVERMDSTFTVGSLRKLTRISPTGGSIVLEIGADMAPDLVDLFSRAGRYGPRPFIRITPGRIG